MSINVTVNGNPVSIRRGRMVLSDLDQIKKNERDRRRRLRLEQVREQSKEISNRLLERAKNVTKAQLTRLEKDGKSELKQMHDQKILDLQRKYQEDMEDIGRAHVSASLQPDVEAMLEADRKRNRFIAAERGKEAVQRLRDSSKVVEDPHSTQLVRLRQVREMENARASMVANLPKRLSPKKRTEQDSGSSEEEQEKRQRSSPRKKKGRKQINKKSPHKVVVESPNVKVVVSQQKQRTRPEPQPGPSGIQAQRLSEVTDISELPRTVSCCESDDQEPRKSVPSVKSSKPDKVASYNPEDYKQNSSGSSGSSISNSSSLSDDSSYFSDGAGDQGGSRQTPRHHTSLAESKVQLYDHNTRQRNVYNRPSGMVERVQIRGEPNAGELAREVLQSESADSRLVEIRKTDARRRGNDALLRERVRRDYQTLMQNLDHLSREERKLRASQIHGPPDIHMDHARRQEVHAKRQRNMDDAFETILQGTSYNSPGNIVNRPPERVVTITPRDEEQDTEDLDQAVWRGSPFFERSEDTEDPQADEENKLSREEQILEMLKKVERQKRLLLREFGANLPDDILNASLNPLFNKTLPDRSSAPPQRREHPPSPPEIKVVNMSSCDECDKRKTKEKEKKKEPARSKKIEIAVQTSTLDEMGATVNKAVQVEFINGKPSSSSSTIEDTNGEPKCYSDEHRSKVITPESSSGSSDSVLSGVVINIDKKQVKVTPKKKKSSLKVSKRNSPRMIAKPRSMPVSKATSPIKRPFKSAPASRQNSPNKTVFKTPEKKVKIQLDKGRVKVKIHPQGAARIFKETSSSSPEYLTSDTFEIPFDQPYRPVIAQPLPKKQWRIRENSDTSTSYTSPPPVTPLPYGRFKDNSTPVLEILNESENENLKAKHDVSPVSSPGTPSPRTIALPTNTPYNRQISKLLQYTTSTDSQSIDNTMSQLLPNQQSTPQEPVNYRQKRSVSPESPEKPEVCTCKTPGCELIHTKMEDIQNYALKNCPEILKKYEDLQNMCTERIASLTDLIEKVRSEQKGMEFSVVPSDESSILQFPGPTPMRNDIHSVRKLVDSIEAIHNQLAKTLNESQRIIASEGVMKPPASSDVQLPTMSSESSTRYKELENTTTETSMEPETDVKGKLRVISNVPVNLTPDQLQALTRPQTNVRVRFGNTSSTPASPTKSPQMDEDLVKLLSKEILEQSKALEKSVGQESMKDPDDSSIRTPTPEVRVLSPRKQTSPSSRNQGSDTPPRMGYSNAENWAENPKSPEMRNDEDFVPLLAGIPKVQRTPPGTQSANNRPRPPVALTYGPFRQEVGSPGHELSTIVEFDTPDTANKSQGSAKSPVKKGKKNLTPTYQNIPVQPVTSPVGPSQDPSSGKYPVSQVTTKSPKKKQIDICCPKPSSLSSPQRSTQTTVRKPATHDGTSQIKRTTDRKITSDVSTTPSSLEKPKTSTNNDVPSKDTSTESNSSMPDISSEMAKRNLVFRVQLAAKNKQGPFRVKEQPHLQEVVPVSTDNDKDKITSTSSNSFSGLSGISEISSTPTSDILKYASSPEEMEAALKKLGLGWAITTLKKTREASALSSSSNSDVTPVNTARKLISPVKKQLETNVSGLPDLSDVSSISIKDASKSTERAVLLKGRTSTPNIENSISNSTDKSSSTTTSSSRASLQDPSDSLTAPNVSLTSMKRSYIKHMKGPYR